MKASMRRDNKGRPGRLRPLLFAFLALMIVTGAAAAATMREPLLGTMAVLGDSYSQPVHASTRNWPTQLQDRGIVRVVANFAASGAQAGFPSGPASLTGQVDAWLRELGRRPPDYTVLYFGSGDVLNSTNLADARMRYRTAVDRLIAAGATQGNRRLVLVQIHDVSHNPAVIVDQRQEVVGWNRFIKSVADARPNVVLVNLASVFDRVIASPKSFGFKNVTTPNQADSATTALYVSGHDFGLHGQAIIAQAIKTAISKGRRSYELVPNRGI